AGGSITTAGLYTAPATPGTFHVRATSQADPTKSATATATVAQVGVTIAPSTPALLTGTPLPFSATVTVAGTTGRSWNVLKAGRGAGNRGGTWSVPEPGGGTTPTAGLYTAPASPGTFHVVATSQADTTKSTAATVTVTQVGVTIAPSTPSLITGRTQPFSATV